MADTKLTDLTELEATPAIDDVFYVADISAGAAGSRKIESRWLWRTDGSASYVSGGGTVALGGYTLTAPATGTVSVIDATQTLTNKTFEGGTVGTASIEGGTIGTATMSGGTIDGATLTDATFSGAVSGTPDLSGGTIADAAITGATIGTPDVTGGTLTDVTLSGYDYDGISIGTSTFTGGTIDSPSYSGDIYTSDKLGSGVTSATGALHLYQDNGGFLFWAGTPGTAGTELIADGTADVTEFCRYTYVAQYLGNVADGLGDLAPGASDDVTLPATGGTVTFTCNANGSFEVSHTATGEVAVTVLWV